MFFSVIVAVYNVAKYFRRGMESLSGQSFHDFEIILVDDGSTDGSAELCDDIAATDPRIRVIHQENAGSGPARNAGIEAARGEYLMFFDVDDLLAINALESVHDSLKEQPVDVLMFGYEEIDPLMGYRHRIVFPEMSCQSNADVRAIYPELLSGMKYQNGFVWNKAYRREFVIDNRLRFEPLRIQQDEVFNLSVYPKVATMAILPKCLYRYFIYHSGNTRSRYIPERMEIYRHVYRAFLGLYEFWQLNDLELLIYIKRRFANATVQYLSLNILSEGNKSGSNMPSKPQAITEIIETKDVMSVLTYLAEHNALTPALSLLNKRRIKRFIFQQRLSAIKSRISLMLHGTIKTLKR